MSSWTFKTRAALNSHVKRYHDVERASTVPDALGADEAQEVPFADIKAQEVPFTDIETSISIQQTLNNALMGYNDNKFVYEKGLPIQDNEGKWSWGSSFTWYDNDQVRLMLLKQETMKLDLLARKGADEEASRLHMAERGSTMNSIINNAIENYSTHLELLDKMNQRRLLMNRQEQDEEASRSNPAAQGSMKSLYQSEIYALQESNMQLALRQQNDSGKRMRLANC